MHAVTNDYTFGPDGPKRRIPTKEEREQMLKDQQQAILQLSQPRAHKREKWKSVTEVAKEFGEDNLRPGLRDGADRMRVRDGHINLRLAEGLSLLKHKLMAASYQAGHGQNVSALFKRFDTNHDGSLSKRELRIAIAKIFGVVDEQEMTVLMDKADKDGNGEVDIQEFTAFLTQYPSHAKHKAKKQLLEEARRKYGEEPSWSPQKQLCSEMRPNLGKGSTFLHTALDNNNSVKKKNPVARLRHKLAAMSYDGSDGQDVVALFEKLDTNHDGSLTQEELEKVLVKVLGDADDRELARMIEKMDSNKDGQIDLDEFANFIMHTNRAKKRRKSSLLRKVEAENGEAPNWQAQTKLESEVASKKGYTGIRHKDHGGGVKLDSVIAVNRVKHKLLAASYRHKTKGHDLNAMFARFDANSDGVLSRAEMHSGMEALLGKIDETEFGTLMLELDGDGNGVVDLEEFMSFVTSLGNDGSDGKKQKKLKRSELEEALVAEHGELPSWQAQTKLESEVASKKGVTAIIQSHNGTPTKLNKVLPSPVANSRSSKEDSGRYAHINGCLASYV